MSDTTQVTATPVPAPAATIKAKIAAAQPDLAAAVALGHSEPVLTTILTLLVDIAPDIIDFFAPAAAPVVGAVDTVLKSELPSL